MGAKRWLTLLVVIALVMGAVPALADTFSRPPETTPLESYCDWVEPYPYQRNVTLNFATDPSTWPVDSVNPSARDLLTDVNYHMEGRLDPGLYPSDWFGWTGPLTWCNEFEGRQGVIGLEGNSPLILTWHLDNWGVHPVKHIYMEMDYYYIPGESCWEGTTDPLFTIFAQEFEDLGGGWQRTFIWFELIPNPLCEDFIWTLYGPGNVMIDNWHIATESVPLPGSVLLLGSGLLGLGGWRRFRKS